MEYHDKFNYKDWSKIGILAATFLPFALVIFSGVGRENPFIVMGVTGLGIVAAAYFLSWATESLQTIVSQAFALAVLALIQVLPEYSFEMVLVWKRQLQFAAATMTGANRLLMGFGWPLIFFVAAFAARRKGQQFHEVKLDKAQSAEVVFLLLATLYSLVIIIRGGLHLIDAVPLVGLYILYLLVILRLPPEDNGHCELESGTGHKIVCLTGWKKVISISAFLLFGFAIIFFGAEPFVESLRHVAVALGIPEFYFIQWFAPFLSEFPESLTAFIWAASVMLAPMGLANLITSKVNQWTLLVASIPIFYSISIGGVGVIPFDSLQMHELLLTVTQTIYGVTCLLGLRFLWRHAVTLALLFSVQFLFPETRLVITWVYLALALVEVVLQRKEITVFRVFREAVFGPREKTPDGEAAAHELAATVVKKP